MHSSGDSDSKHDVISVTTVGSASPPALCFAGGLWVAWHLHPQCPPSSSYSYPRPGSACESPPLKSHWIGVSLKMPWFNLIASADPPNRAGTGIEIKVPGEGRDASISLGREQESASDISIKHNALVWRQDSALSRSSRTSMIFS